MKDSLLDQIKQKNLVLPIMMSLIPTAGLTILMYTGEIGMNIDLVQLSPIQYMISVGAGVLIIPVVEMYKAVMRKTAV
jgi:hypothetical protein